MIAAHLHHDYAGLEFSFGSTFEKLVDLFLNLLTNLLLSTLCKPDMVYILDRAHGLHFFCVSVMPAFYRDYGFQSFIENPE